MAFSKVILLQLLLAVSCIISNVAGNIFEAESCRGADETRQVMAECIVPQNLTGTEGQVFVLDVFDSDLAPCSASLVSQTTECYWLFLCVFAFSIVAFL